MGFTFADYRKQKSRQVAKVAEEVEWRPRLSGQEERFLYSLHLKTIENRTLMATLRATMPSSQFDTFIVEYMLRLKKAKKNFEVNNWKDEWMFANEKFIESGEVNV